MTNVLPATEDDLRVILGWLEREYEEDGDGFWCNRCVIDRSFRKYHDLWVIREEGEAVAFQVGKYGTEIVCVRKDRKRRGYGTTFARYSVDRALEDDMNVLKGECSPTCSLPFWEKMGFERYKDFNAPTQVTVRRVLHRHHEVPIDLPKVEVVVSFYPEDATYTSGVSPFSVHRLTGGQFDGGIVLPCRVIGLTDDAHPKDLVVKVEAGGVELCFCKAKHDEAQAVGVRRGQDGASYYIDEIVTST